MEDDVVNRIVAWNVHARSVKRVRWSKVHDYADKIMEIIKLHCQLHDIGRDTGCGACSNYSRMRAGMFD